MGLRHAATADPEDQPSVAQLIDRCGFLGEPQWMAERQYLNGDADLDPARARCDRAGDAERCRQYRSARLEMKLGEPHHIESPTLGRVDLLHRLIEGLAIAPARE